MFRRNALAIFFAIIVVPFVVRIFNANFSGENLLAEANTQANTEGCAAAMPLYDRAIEYGAGSAGYVKRGLCRSRLQQYDGAFQDWAEVGRLDPKNPGSYLLRANLLEQLNRPDEALKAYDQAIAVDEKRKNSRLFRADFLQRIGKFDLASTAYQALMAADDEPQEASRANAEYAAIQFIQGDNDGALNTLNDGLKRWPDNALILYERGLIELVARNQPEEAATDLLQSVVSGGNYRMVSILLAYATEEVGAAQKGSYFAYAEPFLPTALNAILFLDVARSKSNKPDSDELKKNFDDIAFAVRPVGSLQSATLVGWPVPVVRYFLHEITINELMAQAEKSSGKTGFAVCSASLFAGLRSGNDIGADAGQRYLRNAVETCPAMSLEGRLAALEIQRLGL